VSTQLDIFHPRARRNDPLSSHDAATRLERSGRAAAQMLVVFDAVRANPGCTSKELAERCGLDRHMAARRLSDLWRRGLVERSGDAGRPAQYGDLRWWVKS
jgi:DNA-binding MarR family transcriptional regulator